MSRVRRIREPTVILLLAAVAMAMLACWPWRAKLERATYAHFVIVDITRSMNVEDYTDAGRKISRLAFFKASLKRALLALPCGSRLGLGIFTERRSAILFEPIEVCAGFAAIEGAINQIDWRMAWAADSRIAEGLLKTLALLKDRDADVVFVTDGHEAPPLNPRYQTSFAEVKEKVRGVLVGVGGLTPVPVPKLDEQGRHLGYYSEDEVPQRSTFGEPLKAPDEIEGYHARNAPFGVAPNSGTEHLSSLKDEYLQRLSEASGLGYQRLASNEDLHNVLTRPDLARPTITTTDLRPIPAAISLLCLMGFYGLIFCRSGLRYWSQQVWKLRRR